MAININIGEKSIPPAEGIKFLTGLNILFDISSIVQELDWFFQEIPSSK